MKRSFLLFLSLALMAAGTSCKAEDQSMENGLYAKIKTSKGDITVKLYYRETPLTVTNFVGLAEGKMNTKVKEGPFYDGLTFHRVVDNFVIQGGDPQGNGTGGPGYEFPEEIVEGLDFNSEGVPGMANAGPGTNGSQFYITLAPTPHLSGTYTAFGKVVSGMDVVKSIKQGDTIKKVTIIRIGKEAKGFTADRASFEKLKEKALEHERKAREDAQKVILDEINNRWPGSSVTSEGIRFVIEKEGTGEKPSRGDTISVHYRGMFLDGTQFDSSIDRDKPLEFTAGIGQVIPGWDLTVLDMKVGEKRTVIIPPEMGYGKRGAGGVIPPDSWLVFEVELLEIK